MSMIGGARPEDVPSHGKIEPPKQPLTTGEESVKKTASSADEAAKSAQLKPVTAKEKDLALQFLKHAKEAMQRLGVETPTELKERFKNIHSFVDIEQVSGNKFKIISETPEMDAKGYEIVNNVTSEDIKLLASYEKKFQKLAKQDAADMAELTRRHNIDTQRHQEILLKAEISNLKPFPPVVEFNDFNIQLTADQAKELMKARPRHGVMKARPRHGVSFVNTLYGPDESKGRFLVRASTTNPGEKVVTYCDKENGMFRQIILRFDPDKKMFFERPGAPDPEGPEKPTYCSNVEQYLAVLEKDGEIDRSKGFTPSEVYKIQHGEDLAAPSIPLKYILYTGKKAMGDLFQLKKGKGPDEEQNGSYLVRASKDPKTNADVQVLSYLNKSSGEFEELYLKVENGAVKTATPLTVMAGWSPTKFKSIEEFLGAFPDIVPGKELQPPPPTFMERLFG